MWWSSVRSPALCLNHTRFACLWLGLTMAACLLGGTQIYPGAGVPFYWQSIPQRRAQHHLPFFILKVQLEVLHNSGTALFTTGVHLLDPFSKKYRSPLNPVSRRTLIVFSLTNSLLLALFGGCWISSRCVLAQWRPIFFNSDPNLAFSALIFALALGKLHLVSPKNVHCHDYRTKALVWLTVDTYPRILGMHFLYNLVQLHLCLTNNEATEQLVSLQGLRHCKFAGSLYGKFFLCSSFSDFVWPIGASRSGPNCFMTSTMAPNTFPTSCMDPCCSRRHLTTMTWTKYSSCSLGQRQTSENFSHWETWPWFAWCLSSCAGR